jgi:hypothetical protein
MPQLMLDGNWHSREELVEKTGHRFSVAKHILVKAGYKFEMRHIKQQEYDYRLVIEEQSLA